MSASSSREENPAETPKDNKPAYTRKLIPRVYIDPLELDGPFDEKEWNKKAYGPDIKIIGFEDVPRGWIWVDGNSPPIAFLM